MSEDGRSQPSLAAGGRPSGTSFARLPADGNGPERKPGAISTVIDRANYFTNNIFRVTTSPDVSTR